VSLHKKRMPKVHYTLCPWFST